MWMGLFHGPFTPSSIGWRVSRSSVFASPGSPEPAEKDVRMDPTLAVRGRGITRCFGDVVALDAVDLDLVAGRVHGLVGPNGAGKTTLLGLLLGLSVADRGTLEILGVPVSRALAAP